jgi:hypothetical protein
MVSHSEIYQGLKDLLNLDSDLSELIGQNSSGSKIILGPELPKVMFCPMIQVVIMTDNMETSTQVSDIFFRINIYTNADINNAFNSELSESIIQRAFALIHDQRITLEASFNYVMYAEGRDAEAIADFEHSGIYFEGLSCRMVAA